MDDDFTIETTSPVELAKHIHEQLAAGVSRDSLERDLATRGFSAEVVATYINMVDKAASGRPVTQRRQKPWWQFWR
ncbi:MAG: hypothetical protein KJO31_09340 [Gammaproteobacteria bacterium]|nr:hypothetical protein [Gammaproteobacteria bacterium]